VSTSTGKANDDKTTPLVKNEDGITVNEDADLHPTIIADVEQPFISAGQASDIRQFGQATDPFTGATLTESDLP
jgi:hypothetical protein